MSKKTTAPEATTTALVIPSREELLAPIAAARLEIEKEVEAAKVLTIEGHVDGEKAGYIAVSNQRKTLKGLKSAVEKARKGSKAPVLELGRAVDGLADELESMILPELRRLEALEKGYEDKQAEEKRKRDRAIADRLAARVKAAAEIGATLDDINMTTARDSSDEEWAKEMERIQGAVAARKLEQNRSDALRAVGANVPFGIGEWSEAEYDDYLTTAVEAKKASDEQAEADRAADELRREGDRRSFLLAAQGVAVSSEDCAKMIPSDFEAALATAKEEKARRDTAAQQERDELTRLRAEDDARRADDARKEREANETRRREAEARRNEALRPDRDALSRWRLQVIEAIEHAPILADSSMCSLRDEVEALMRSALDRIAFEEQAEPVPATVDDDDITLEF